MNQTNGRVERFLNQKSIWRPIKAMVADTVELAAEDFPEDDPAHIEAMRVSFQWNVPEDTRIELLARLSGED